MKRPALLIAAWAAIGCAPQSTLRDAAPVEVLGAQTREPMLAELPDGSLFVAGYGEATPVLWASRDRGATWQRVDVGSERAGARGNSDVDLAVAPDGTLYFASMTYDRKAFEGRAIDVGVSADSGRTWRWSRLSETRFDDRPWVEVAPDGTAHVVWNDGGVRHAVSRDAGRSWREQPRIHEKGGSSHFTIGPAGELAVRITPLSASANRFDAGVDFVAVSRDGGRTWTKHAPPLDGAWRPFDENVPFQRWVEPLAWDADGALYALTSHPGGLWLARSADGGARWATTLVVPTDDVVFFPYLVARRPGELLASWFSRTGASLEAHVALIDAAPGTAPRIVARHAFRPDSWQRQPPAGQPAGPDTAGEYFPVAFLRDGGAGAVNTIQNTAAGRSGFVYRKLEIR